MKHYPPIYISRTPRRVLLDGIRQMQEHHAPPENVVQLVERLADYPPEDEENHPPAEEEETGAFAELPGPCDGLAALFAPLRPAPSPARHPLFFAYDTRQTILHR